MTPLQRLAQREFFGIKLGLDNVRALTTALDHPERASRRVIVAGTNGKGSVCAILSRALHAAGHRVGLYTSPHLIHLTERFRIGERDVDQDALDAALVTVFDAEARLLDTGGMEAPATYFELTTVTAFELFRRAYVDVAVLEVGLGGRFDATNIAEAPFAVITSVGLDHMAQLGSSVAAIAIEKAGVIQPSSVVVCGTLPPDAERVVIETAAARGARLIDASQDVLRSSERRGLDTWASWRTPRATYGPLPLALRGRHQVDNAAVAVRMLETLDAGGIAVPHEAIEAGLQEAWWPGRLQVIAPAVGPQMIIDGAHNADGAAALAAWLDEVGLREVTLVTAVMRDKDVTSIIGPLAARASAVIVTQVLPPRGLEATTLRDALAALVPAVPVSIAETPAAALARARQSVAPVVVAGSLFLAGAALQALTEQGDPP